MLREDIAPLPGYHPEIGLLLASLKDSTREWRENLGEPPVEAITWQIALGSYSIGALLLHMADVELFWFEKFVGGREPSPEDLRLLMSEEVRQYEGVWPAPPPQPIGWYYELQDRYRERAWKALGSTPTPVLPTSRDHSPSPIEREGSPFQAYSTGTPPPDVGEAGEPVNREGGQAESMHGTTGSTPTPVRSAHSPSPIEGEGKLMSPPPTEGEGSFGVAPLPSDTFFPDGDEFETSLRWVVSHVVQHDAYHGGQAVLLHEVWKAGRDR